MLSKFAKNYKTGEPISADLVTRMNRASAFGRANWVTRQNSYSAISYDIYKTKPEDVNLDAVTLGDSRKYTLLVPPPDAHLWASFNHLSSYSSAYYTYQWSLVIAKDLFSAFDPADLFDTEVAGRYRDRVLAPGGAKDAADLVEDFLGRPFTFAAYADWLAR